MVRFHLVIAHITSVICCLNETYLTTSRFHLDGLSFVGWDPIGQFSHHILVVCSLLSLACLILASDHVL